MKHSCSPGSSKRSAKSCSPGSTVLGLNLRAQGVEEWISLKACIAPIYAANILFCCLGFRTAPGAKSSDVCDFLLDSLSTGLHERTGRVGGGVGGGVGAWMPQHTPRPPKIETLTPKTYVEVEQKRAHGNREHLNSKSPEAWIPFILSFQCVLFFWNSGQQLWAVGGALQ